MNEMVKIIIVNEKDVVIGSKERGKVTSNDIYRVSALWLTDSAGRILLAQRGLKKSHDPGKWGPAVAGTLEEGETYESNIRKETLEELGIEGIKLMPVDKVNSTSKERKHKYFAQWFIGITDKKEEEFKIQKSEVEQVKWFTPKLLRKKVKENPENYLEIVQKWANDEALFLK